MPYVNIPDSGLTGTIAKLVGKLQGQVVSHALKISTEVSNQLNKDGCPPENTLRRLRRKKQNVENKLSSIDRRLSKIRKLPKALKIPVKGLKAALKLILTLPIPQAVPPGFGLPINLTTNYADIMHLVKEFIKQISDDIEGIEVILQTPSITLGSITRNLARTDNALKSCEADLALQKELEGNTVTLQELEALGLLNEDETFIFSTLGPKLLSNNTDDNFNLRYKGKYYIGRQYYIDDIISYLGSKWSCTKDHISIKNGDSTNGLPGIGPWVKLAQQELDSINTLNSLLNNIDGSDLNIEVKDRLKNLLDTFIAPPEDAIEENPNFFHTGPNGTVYKLEIIIDPESPQIAPRRFAVAKNKDGTVVLKGQKSFSSSTQILLDEIKFRIDNQLP